MYVKRDDDGAIIKVSKRRDDECQEAVESRDMALREFLGVTGGEDELTRSDLDFVRVLEDVIHLLMDKGVIRFTDLPDAARDKLVTRQSLRRRINDVGLMGSEDDVI
ncbi:tryptophan synthase subunit beta like protein [Halomonas sp. 328]|uniref:tryptophan synthase subunit beta like protein n=1 Tax=Halomonas sp. 328 TaxID=2776704 RepID=UPI0018A6D9EC|nr:tryptophan synthase subunit beta like protein [Halomonas sp. 328]MBF8221417.1 tryptophan synthase subunit beta like protein [Halomonas sp. 328]